MIPSLKDFVDVDFFPKRRPVGRTWDSAGGIVSSKCTDSARKVFPVKSEFLDDPADPESLLRPTSKSPRATFVDGLTSRWAVWARRWMACVTGTLTSSISSILIRSFTKGCLSLGMWLKRFWTDSNCHLDSFPNSFVRNVCSSLDKPFTNVSSVNSFNWESNWSLLGAISGIQVSVIHFMSASVSESTSPFCVRAPDWIQFINLNTCFEFKNSYTTSHKSIHVFTGLYRIFIASQPFHFPS